MKQYDSFEDEIEARCRPCEEHEFPRIATYRCCYTDDESPGKRLQVSKFQSTSTNSDIQNSDMIGAKKTNKKTKQHKLVLLGLIWLAETEQLCYSSIWIWHFKARLSPLLKQRRLYNTFYIDSLSSENKNKVWRKKKKNESKAATECVTLMLTMSVTANWLTRWAALAETLCWMPVWQKRPLKACCFHSSVCKLNVWLDRLCSRLHAACRPNDSI